MITTFFLRILALFFNSYLSKKIGAEAIGLFQLIMSVYLFVITLSSSGIQLATTRIVAEELALGNTKGANQSAKKAIAISFFCSLFISILLFLFSNLIVHTCFQDKVSVWVVYLMGIALPFIAMSSAINGYFTGLRKTYKSASRTICRANYKNISLYGNFTSIFASRIRLYLSRFNYR